MGRAENLQSRQRRIETRRRLREHRRSKSLCLRCGTPSGDFVSCLRCRMVERKRETKKRQAKFDHLIDRQANRHLIDVFETSLILGLRRKFVYKLTYQGVLSVAEKAGRYLWFHQKDVMELKRERDANPRIAKKRYFRKVYR